MASKLKEKDESPDLYTCYICRSQVPLESETRHKASYLHQAALKIASTALERLRAHVAPISDSAKDPVESSQEKEHTDAPSISFCGSCAAVFPSSDHAKHIRNKIHLMAALDDQVFDELVRGYVEKEEIQFLEGISKDPCDDGEMAVDESEATNTYTCHMCALDIPKAFKNEHELSSRHRACLALANAASQRTIAFLTPTPIRVGTPNKTLEDKMVALLKVYTGVDIKKQEHIETEEEIEVAKDKPSEIKKRLTPREYFTEIMPFIPYVGGFYILIVDDTEYVTIKTEKDTYLRVHMSNFNGIHNMGGTEYQINCSMCDGYHRYIYSSTGNSDKMHVMSLGHIKNVLTPINTHGIRKIDNTYFLCVLCNVCIPTHSVEDHIMRDIQHTAFLAEALEKGKLFKENDNDMKFIIYTAPPVEETKSGLFMRNPPPNFNSVLKPHYGIFGRNTPANTGFGQSTGQNASLFAGGQPASNQSFGKSGAFGVSNDQPTLYGTTQVTNQSSGTGFGQNSPTSGNGQSTGQSASLFAVVQPASNQSFGKTGAFGVSNNQPNLYRTAQASNQSSGTGFGQNSGTGFGQINQPINIDASVQPTSTQSFGNGGNFGVGGFEQSTTFGSPGTGFGQSKQADDNNPPQPASVPFGQNIAQTTGALYGTSNQSTVQTSHEKSDD